MYLEIEQYTYNPCLEEKKNKMKVRKYFVLTCGLQLKLHLE